jgi:hypothetical protein
MLRRYLVALFNDSRGLPALERDGRVHFEHEARACALDVAALLPAALARVEAAQQRPFARGPTIGVYASYEIYARANGLEGPAIAVVSRSERVLLSPTLCRADRARLRDVLTHELSHVHLFGWRSSLFSARRRDSASAQRRRRSGRGDRMGRGAAPRIGMIACRAIIRRVKSLPRTP